MKQLEMLETTDKLKCSVCLELKDEEAFALFAASKRGRVYKCKECSKVYKRQHYLKNKENYAAKKRSRQRNSSKHKSVSAVYHAIKAGKLVRQPCEECGAEKAEAHHDDYAKPLEVRWLCRSHHRQWHVEHGEAKNACTVRHWTPPQEATQ